MKVLTLNNCSSENLQFNKGEIVEIPEKVYNQFGKDHFQIIESVEVSGTEKLIDNKKIKKVNKK